MMKTIDIRFNGEGLERRLSNLYPYPFEYDGIHYGSMEAFFSSIRTPGKRQKKKIYEGYGMKVWYMGHQYDWKEKQVVYYKNKVIDRHSSDYDNLITGAFDALFQNAEYREVLKEAEGCKLMHFVGKSGKSNTLLTRSEFIGQLNRLRKRLSERTFYDLSLLLNI